MKQFLLNPAVLSLCFATSLLGSESLLSEEKANSWKMAGPGSFELQDGVATARGGMGLWWFSEKEFRNFTLELEFKWDDPSWNSGIFVRFPDPAGDPWVAIRQGYEQQVSGTAIHNQSTGSIYDIQAPALLPEIKNGEWNKYTVTCVGPWIVAFVNDTLVNVFRCQPGRGDEKGFIGLQNHDNQSAVQFRNVTVKEWGDNETLMEVFSKQGVARSQLIAHNAARWPQGQAPFPGLRADNDWYRLADHGPAFMQSYGYWDGGEYQPNSALKGMVISYSPDPHRVALFDAETLSLVSAANQGVRFDNTPWAGAHGQLNKFVNNESALFVNTAGPAWADATGSFEDKREFSPHGNLSHARYLGHYRHGNSIVLEYQVNGTRMLDLIEEHPQGLIRHLEVAPHDAPLTTRLAKVGSTSGSIATAEGKGSITEVDGYYVLSIPSSTENVVIPILYSAEPSTTPVIATRSSLSSLRSGGPGLYPETFNVEAELGAGDGPWLVDNIPLPPVFDNSPYRSHFRTSDFDFFADGDRAAVCTWDGDVWLVTGLKEFKTLTWKRFATGLFEPLGLRIVDDVVYVSARDAIFKLHDLNGDNECDHYENFNNDVLITNNFHEFAFGLETDPAGNFIVAKGGPVRNGGRGFDTALKHNGTIYRVSKDGKSLEILATGVRAPGGIGVGPNGEITTGENEGTWQPCCKLNYFTPNQAPVFLGVEDLAGELKGKALHEPLCYLPMHVDNSGGGQVWVPEYAKIGLKAGELLHLSYGRSSIFRVLTQDLGDGKLQGGVAQLPLQLRSSAQRAAFHPDGSMYVLGLRGWQTNAATDAAFHRIRYVEGAINPLPDKLSVTKDGIEIRFETELDEEIANDPTSYSIEKWKYVRGPQYGSGEFSIDEPNLEMEQAALTQESHGHRVRDKVEVTSVKLQPDGKTLLIQCSNLTEAQQMEIAYDLETTDGEILVGKIVNTVHELR